MRIEAQLAYLGLKPQIAFEIDGVTSILDLIREGYGHTVLPLNSLRGQGLGRDLVTSPVVRPTLTIQLSLVTSAQRPTTPLTRGALSLVRRTVIRVLFAEKS
jgi:LysR family nitrogen assimilation transcriptional regulator